MMENEEVRIGGMFLNLKVVVSDKLNISVPVFNLSASNFFSSKYKMT